MLHPKRGTAIQRSSCLPTLHASANEEGLGDILQSSLQVAEVHHPERPLGNRMNHLLPVSNGLRDPLL
jgi:hypothetical protein